MLPPASESDPLTPREREVLQLIAAGMSTKQIADALGISFKTAVSHRTHLMQKLDLHSVADVVRYTLRGTGATLLERVEIEQKLLEEVRAAEREYRKAAKDYYVELDEAQARNWTPDSDGELALFRAGRTEREALEKYVRLLKAFATLVRGPGEVE